MLKPILSSSENGEISNAQFFTTFSKSILRSMKYFTHKIVAMMLYPKKRITKEIKRGIIYTNKILCVISG